MNEMSRVTLTSPHPVGHDSTQQIGAEADANDPIGRATSEALAGQVCAAASLSAQATSRMLRLLGEFDASDAVRFQDGCGTTARWLAWACSMSPGVAREHVRIARALRRMPTVAGLFDEGRLSYSKVRAATRLVDVVDEAGLAELAKTMTAAQLDVTVSGFRSAAGTRIRQEDRRRVSWADRGTGMVSITAQLPVEEAAVVIAAIETSRDAQPVDERCTVDALLDVARGYLAGVPRDESGEDRTMVVVQVSADVLSQTLSDPAPPGGWLPTSTVSDGLLPGSLTSDPAAPDSAPVPSAPATALIRDETRGGPGDLASGADGPAGTSDHAPAVRPRPGSTGSTSSPPPAIERPGDRRTVPPVPTSASDVPAGTDDCCDRHPSGTCAVATSQTAATTHTTVTTRTGITATATTGTSAATGQQPRSKQAADPVWSGTCHVAGVGPLEAATAARLSCDATLLGAVVDAHGDVLALGRTRRLVSKAQRRALMVRDRICQYPGCHQSRHVKAHHVIAWYAGGATDLDNLVLLCQRHHTFVHEGGLTITSTGHHLATGRVGWRFTLPTGQDVGLPGHDGRRPGWDEPTLWKLQQHAERDAVAALDRVRTMRDPAADAIVPGWRGEPFSVHDCVAALFSLQARRRRPQDPDPATSGSAATELAA